MLPPLRSRHGFLGGILALTGFNYSAVTGELSLTSKPGHYFWSDGYAYGTFDVKDNGSSKSVRINVIKGQLTVTSVELKGSGKTAVPIRTLKEGDEWDVKDVKGVKGVKGVK
ncbi:MAG: hypothetical protein WC865_17345 [Bacteroidales bacterium]